MLNEQIAYLTKKLFGSSSEKRNDFEGQLSLFDEAENVASEEEMPKLETTVKSHTRKSRKSLTEKLKGIHVEQVIPTFLKKNAYVRYVVQPLKKSGVKLSAGNLNTFLPE